MGPSQVSEFSEPVAAQTGHESANTRQGFLLGDLHSLFSDVSGSMVLLALAVVGIRFTTRRLDISMLPALVVMFALVPIGLLFHYPKSPGYTRSDGQSYLVWGSEIAEK
jgi:hypothetical protein